jgi:hypothetical protein
VRNRGLDRWGACVQDSRQALSDPISCSDLQEGRHFLVAGRSISVNREVPGSIRYTPICMAIGQGAGVRVSSLVFTPAHAYGCVAQEIVPDSVTTATFKPSPSGWGVFLIVPSSAIWLPDQLRHPHFPNSQFSSQFVCCKTCEIRNGNLNSRDCGNTDCRSCLWVCISSLPLLCICVLFQPT